MMEVERVETVPSFDIKSLMFSPKMKLEHSFDDATPPPPSKQLKTTPRNELTSSYGIDAARVVELDLLDEDDSEDEG